MGARVFIAVLVACGSTASGCATLFKGDVDTIRVSSLPEGQVRVDGGEPAITPGTVEVSSGDRHELVLQAPGHRDQVVFVEPELNDGYLVLDLLLLVPLIVPGAVALLIDSASGAWYRATPVEVDAVMVPDGDASSEAEPGDANDTSVREAADEDEATPDTAPDDAHDETAAPDDAHDETAAPDDAHDETTAPDDAHDQAPEPDDGMPPTPPDFIPDEELPLPPPS